MEEKINKLKSLIADYDEVQYELHRMIQRWMDHDDPGSDPGLQYEQEAKMEKAYKAVVEYAQTLTAK